MPKLINKPPALPGFFEDLGTFHAVWQGLDVVMDFAIGHSEGLSPTETLSQLGAGRSFQSKLGKLRRLIEQSQHPEKSGLMRLMSDLFAAKRNEITHSYLDTEEDEVKFVYPGSESAKPCTLSFREREFTHHVAEFVECANRFQEVLNLDRQALDRFAEDAGARFR